ncbi:MAG: DUF2934 domain-containing protein [Planctomycetes bacterium]|nr:DUF2934 domain-containing protein [Planctomycetota bacterium]
MNAKIKPVGTNRNTWTDWQTPIDICQERIPPSPGVYQLAAFVDNPIYPQPNKEREAKAACKDSYEAFNGIVYTGKAVCLQERFGLLVQSWQPNVSSGRHGSRKSYNCNYRGCQQKFTPCQVKCRWKQIGSINWLEQRETLKRVRNNQGSLADHLKAIWGQCGKPEKASNPPRRNNMYDTVWATFSEESKLLKKFHKIFGCLPLLNRRSGESLGERNGEWLVQWVEAEESAMESIPSDDGIRFRAFENWRDRGCPSNDDWVDWFAAELALWERVILEE